MFKKNKLFLTCFTLLVFPGIVFSQRVLVTDDAGYASTPGDPSAVLDVFSTNYGFLAPRMTMAQRDAIYNPAAGLLIYQSDNTPGFYFFDGSQWGQLSAANSNYWADSGGNIYNTNGGVVGIGTSSPEHMLDVGGDAAFAGDIHILHGYNLNLECDDVANHYNWHQSGEDLHLHSDQDGGDSPRILLADPTGNFYFGNNDNDEFRAKIEVTPSSNTDYAIMVTDGENGTPVFLVDNSGNISVGADSPFQVNSLGDLIAINSVPMSWPGSQAEANTFLHNDGNGGLSWQSCSGSIPSMSQGSVVFSNGGSSLGEDNSRFYWDNSGKRLSIGTNTFDGTNPEKLKVDAGTTTSKNVISGYGSIDSYLQLNIKNSSTGTSASSDVVATANNGDENGGYIDLGINGQNYNQAGYNIGGANDGYLYCMGAGISGGNLTIGTGTSGKVIKFHTGGTTSSQERMRIDGTGKVGIGSTSPNSILEVNGAVTLDKVASTPTCSAGQTVVYTKGNYYVILYNDAGTYKYRYMDLTSTNATWTYSTTAP
jgi:hypothetical protein